MASNFKSKSGLFCISLLHVLYPRLYPYLYLVNSAPNDLDITWVAEKICTELKNDTEWERFGMYLLGTRNNDKVTLINQDNKGNLDKCKELLSLWMRGTSDPKWEQVAQALKKVNLLNLATELERAVTLEQPDNPYISHVEHLTHHDQVDGQGGLQGIVKNHVNFV